MTTPQDLEKTTDSYTGWPKSSSTTMKDMATHSEATAPYDVFTTPVDMAGKSVNGTVKEEEPQASDDGNEPTRAIRGFRWLLSSIVETFGHVDQLAWIGAGFPLGSIAVVLPIGVLFTRFNMKWFYISSLVLFEVGSAVCGVAPNMNAIIVGRVIVGAGGVGFFLGCPNYFSTMTVPSERGLYIASIGLCWGGGTVLGPIIGGAFSVSSATWRWAFYINLVIAAVTAPVYLLFLPPLRPVQGQSLLQRITDLDVMGFILSAAMWTSFAMVATMAGGQWPWHDGRTIALWVVFGLLLISYILQQWLCIFTTPQTRSFPVHLLASRTQVLLGITTASNVAVCFCVIYFIPLYFQFVHGDGALLAAVRLLPFITLNVSTNLAVGHFLPRIQYYVPMYVCSGLLSILGSGLLMGYIKTSTSQGTIYGILVLLGFGSGLTFSMGFSVSTLKVKPSDIGNVISFQDICQLGSSTIVLVIAGQVFQSRATANLEHVLAGKGFSSAEIQGAVAGAQSTLFKQLDASLKLEAVNAITEAIQRTFVLTIVGAAIMTLAGACMRVEKIFDASSTRPEESEATQLPMH
ncbi:hypothetical protein ACHAPE_001580 [Trichoderma viride]